MRAAPPLQVKAERFDLWNALLAGLAVLVLLVMSAWFASDTIELPLWGAWSMAGGTLGVLLALVTSTRRAPVGLRWDSQHWYCTGFGEVDREEGPWRVRVPIDLGGFMLLRLDAPGDPRGWISRWLPVQRFGLRGDWHALRCALSAHSPEVARASAAPSVHSP